MCPLWGQFLDDFDGLGYVWDSFGFILVRFRFFSGPFGTVLGPLEPVSGSFGFIFVRFGSFWVPSGGHIVEMMRPPPNN